MSTTNESDRLVHQDQVARWICEVRFRDSMVVKQSNIKRSNAWALKEGAIRHVSNRFFRVIGLKWGQPGEMHASIFLDQRETGILGVIAKRASDGLDILINAKAEPGNCGFVQLAPTCQATASNIDRVHGGELPPFSSYFLRPHGEVISDSLQSEHGMRFFGKLNRNIFVIENTLQKLTAEHCWLPFRLLAKILNKDFLVNTDLRSVLCSTDWSRLIGGLPFNGPDDFTKELRQSFVCIPRQDMISRVWNQLDVVRINSSKATFVDIPDVAGFRYDCDNEHTVSNGIKSVRHIEVMSCTREVHTWDQPIFEDTEEKVINLFCAQSKAGLVFAFRVTWEPGLARLAELGPTSQTSAVDRPKFGSVRLSVKQSDEGGRFYRCVSTYCILDTGQVSGEDEYLWLTLSEIHSLLPLGVFNNESRSALSLLLCYL